MKNTTIIEPLHEEADYEALQARLCALTANHDGVATDDELEVLNELVDEFEDDEEDEPVDDDDDYEAMSRIPEAETVPLANFSLSNGNEVQIVGVPVLREILMGEIVDAGEEDFLINPDMPPCEVFQRLAPRDSAVPQMLASIDHNNLFDGREFVEAIEKPIYVHVDQIGIETGPAAAPTGLGSCQPGPAGAQYFKDHHCNTLGGPGYGKSESYCFPAGVQWRQKTSSSRRRATYARMASCGTGMNRMRHFYKTVSGYKTQVNVFVDPKKVVSWWSAKKGIRRRRRVRFEAHESGGWVRGWVKFDSQVAGGWF